MAKPQSFLFRIIYFIFNKKKKSGRQEKGKQFYIEKRQKFAIGVGLLSVMLFLSAYFHTTYGIFMVLFLAFFSDLFLLWTIYGDLKNNFSSKVFILPFLYSLSFGLFSFLTPARLLTRLILTILYAIGLYSVFLSQNIFTVASIRTIALLNSGRIVSLVISLIAYFFLTNTAFSLRVSLLPTGVLLFIFSFLFTSHAMWTYTLEKSLKKDLVWILVCSLCLVELGIALWYWPTSPTVVALFLTSVWYIFIGLSHIWFDRRLFRNVLWEYVWVAVIAVLVLISFTKWQ